MRVFLGGALIFSDEQPAIRLLAGSCDICGSPNSVCEARAEHVEFGCTECGNSWKVIEHDHAESRNGGVVVA